MSCQDFYHWTRDSALTFKALIDRLADSYDADLQTEIQNCGYTLISIFLLVRAKGECVIYTYIHICTYTQLSNHLGRIVTQERG
jgi:hypothetical protein